jgi:hypothetical protein
MDPTNRRAFLEGSLMALATGAARVAAPSSLRLSLSTRMAETKNSAPFSGGSHGAPQEAAAKAHDFLKPYITRA